MKKIWTIAAFLLWLCASPAHSSCAVMVRHEVEVAGPSLSLADLLAGSGCPGILRGAAGVALGRAPLPGSDRVFDGGEIRRAIERVASSATDIEVPERIRVRRRGRRESCADLDMQIENIQIASSPTAERVECGAAGRIAGNAPVALRKAVWDPSLHRWEAVAHCAHAADCVPFLIQMPGQAPEAERSAALPKPNRAVAARSAWNAEDALVRPGQMATLLWDQEGIRLTGPATSLDRGALGERVRARIAPGRVVRAVVVGRGVLRVVS